ncbi:Clp protease N-terminal domain-containing protein [Streptomyces sp. ATE26]|uniref:Clp protease N-terminal domain-containing protein n=1 Tax=Streptomyces sp. ATE26 TaxID=2954237 RepID=UPI0024825D6D|nr:Clp protease N-terminal domain-containing protein [Streptomyces sp. ATE26]MDI1458654.1 Clp protease N-terminal domain-containing protein [Streptomyces sp. ATE26]
MHPRTARRSIPDQGLPHTDDDAVLGAELAAVVAGARRRAVRDGDRQIDTAHLLHSLLEHDPEVRAAVGGAPRLARLLGYLVQRSIGYGLRWQRSLEGAGALAVLPGPARYDAGHPGGAAHGDTGHWSPVAAVAVEEARRRARRRGAARTSGTDLLAGLVLDPRSRAVEVLERAGVRTRELGARLDGRPADARP